MAKRSLKPCAHPGCTALVRKGNCPAHTRVRDWKRDDSNRPSSTARGYDRKHQQWREQVLTACQYLCVECKAHGRITPATVAHHIQPVKKFPNLRYDADNGRGLCHRCHEHEEGRSKRAGWV